MQTHTQQPTLQLHKQREGCGEQLRGCRRTPNSPPYSTMVNERDATSNGKYADAHTTANPTEPWPTRGMWQATARMPMYTQHPTLQRHGQREGCYEQRQGCRCTHNSPPYSAMVNERDVMSNRKNADAHTTAHPTEPWSTRRMWQATARMPKHT